MYSTKVSTALKIIWREISSQRRSSSVVSLPDIDTNYFCNEHNTQEIRDNIRSRKSVCNIDYITETSKTLMQTSPSSQLYKKLKVNLYEELLKLPNKTHPIVKNENEPLLVKTLGKKLDSSEHNFLEFSEISRLLNLMRTDKLGHTCGHKSYYFLDKLAQLEEALIKYTVTNLVKRNFNLLSVPDLLPGDVLESCGMMINKDRTQIYSLDPVHHGPDLYLSGTAEMSLAGLLRNSVHCSQKLPIKLAAVSRCYRAETSNVLEERGIYRVHQFTKVEMFIVSTPEQSDEMLEYIRQTQETLFSPLGIHMRVLDMPPYELGSPAYRKYDIEAWMPGRKNYGEISSCSNCTDYQSRRLNIKFNDGLKTDYVHTLNGTACAIPRMLIALIETHQDPKGKLFIPQVLQPYMGNESYITKNKHVPELKLMKIKK